MVRLPSAVDQRLVVDRELVSPECPFFLVDGESQQSSTDR